MYNVNGGSITMESLCCLISEVRRMEATASCGVPSITSPRLSPVLSRSARFAAASSATPDAAAVANVTTGRHRTCSTAPHCAIVVCAFHSRTGRGRRLT